MLPLFTVRVNWAVSMGVTVLQVAVMTVVPMPVKVTTPSPSTVATVSSLEL